MNGQFFWVRLFPGVGFDANTVVARYDMKVKVKYRLPGGRFVELLNVNAIGAERRFYGAGNFLYRRHDFSERTRVRVEEIA